ncbi:hypothetical protein [Nesterenkonia sp. CF4.4]|uniref:hypothetical protein n=1 Tax=Nesterenkonia sp. CF4.4 TaxID=3373079 RepID=UPI003EE47DA1
MAALSARQAATRMEARIERAEAAGIPDEKLQRRMDKLIGAYERTTSREQAARAAPADGGAASPAAAQGDDSAADSRPAAIGPAKPSAADSITAARVHSMSWDELAEYSGSLGDDPEAWDKLEGLIDEREKRESSAAEIRGWLETAPAPDFDTDPVTNPAARPQRAVTPHERAREEFDCHRYAQHRKAENDLGYLLNAEGRAAGIDDLSLFSGPISRVKKYGSEELQAWFNEHGRMTLASFRHSLFGWASDARAAQRAKTQGFDHVANV